ncbi:MAG: hypothetical protein HC780_28255 [Leptolyngbyaceae cyanobacterium CSU_1_3]|nr:hypothetical protein [Leptolyngbyaceae cyanobacterium CSU_1_3]
MVVVVTSSSLCIAKQQVVGVDLCTSEELDRNVRNFGFEFLQLDVLSEKWLELDSFDVVLFGGDIRRVSSGSFFNVPPDIDDEGNFRRELGDIRKTLLRPDPDVGSTLEFQGPEGVQHRQVGRFVRDQVVTVEAASVLGQAGGQPGQGGAVHLDPVAFHARQGGNNGPVYQFIYARRLFRRQTQFQMMPQAQGDVGILGRIAGRIGKRHLREAYGVFPPFRSGFLNEMVFMLYLLQNHIHHHPEP